MLDLSLEVNTVRRHSDAQIKKIANSVKEFGQLRPIVVSEGQVIAGKGLYLALESLGRKIVYGVDASNLTLEQQRAFMIADNRLAEDSFWNAREVVDMLDQEVSDVLGAVELGANFQRMADLLVSGDDEDDEDDDEGDNPSLSPRAPAAESDYVTVEFVVTVEDKDLIIEKINQLKDDGCETAGEALMKIMESTGV